MKPTRCTCDLPLCAGVKVLNTESREIKQRECHQYLNPVTIQVCRLSLRSLNSVTEEIHASPCEIVTHVAMGSKDLCSQESSANFAGT